MTTGGAIHLGRQPAAYEDMSVSSFVHGYIITMNSEDSAIKAKMIQILEELMGDVYLYGCERVHAYHGIWRNQLEQGRFT